MNELVTMFRQMHDEQVAWQLYRTLDHAQPEYLAQIQSVLERDDCDRADDLSKYSAIANEQLAIAILEHAPELLDRYGDALRSRRSARFRSKVFVDRIAKDDTELVRLLSAAMDDDDASVTENALWAFKKRLAKGPLPEPTRRKLFDLLAPRCVGDFQESGLTTAPALLAHMDPVQSRLLFASDEVLNPRNGLLPEILRYACELESDVHADRLIQLIDSVSEAAPNDSGTINRVTRAAVSMAMRKQCNTYRPVFERGIEMGDKTLKQLSLSGLVKLRMPFDPIGKSIERIQSNDLKAIPVSARVVGFVSQYIDIAEHDGLLGFARSVSPKAFRATCKSLRIINSKPHARLLTWLLEELDDHPRRTLKSMSVSEASEIQQRIDPKQSRLDFQRLQTQVLRYVLSHEESLNRLK